MIVFLAVLAAATVLGVFMTERIDRPRPRRRTERLAQEAASKA